MTILKRLLASIGIILGLGLALTGLTQVSAQTAFALSLAITIASIAALFRPLPKLWLGSRAFASALLIVVGIPMMTASSGTIGEQQEAHLAKLKATDSDAYLAALQGLDEMRWLSELKKIDPEQHAIALKERKDRRAKEIAIADAKAQQQRLWECGSKNETAAYVMSQSYVQSRLKAPSSAKFPWITAVQSKAIGGCLFQVNAYVDAQNSFGATLRTPYSALMRYNPSKQSWVPIELNLAN